MNRQASGRSRTRALPTALLCAVVGTIIIGAALWCRAPYYPVRLQRADAYLLGKPRLFAYCAVRVGTTETEITGRFGAPHAVLRASDGSYGRHIAVRRRDHWALPGRRWFARVLVYTDCDGGVNQIDVYYFLDERGSLVSTFVSEG